MQDSWGSTQGAVMLKQNGGLLAAVLYWQGNRMKRRREASKRSSRFHTHWILLSGGWIVRFLIASRQ
jgi:hypothetical protein